MSNHFQRWFHRFSQWFAGSAGKRPGGKTGPRLRLRRTIPRLEHLETRLAPATYIVTGLADGTGTVTPTNTAGVFVASTLRAAITAVTNSTNGQNNVIDLSVQGTYKITLAGTPGETDNAAGEFAIIPSGTNGSSLAIQNSSGGTVTVDGNHLNRVFDINPSNVPTTPKFSVTMTGFAIINGIASPGDAAPGSGGGIRDQNNVSLTLNNMTIANNLASADGGGVSMENAPASTPWTLTVNNSTVTGNHAGDAGGGLETDGSGKVFVNGSTISSNTCVNQGAGIWLDAILASNGTVGSATVTAGGMGYTTAPTVTINDPTGVGATGVATIANGMVISLAITNGGTGYTAPTITFTGGGGTGAAATANLNVLQSANLTVTGSLITNNKALSATTGVGGGIGNAGNGAVSILSSVLTANTAGGVGGGFSDQNNQGTLTVANSFISGNLALGNGGGIEEGGPLTSIANSLIQGNSTGGVGGGLFIAGGALVLASSTIAGNTAASNGGGIELATTGTGLNASTITNATIVNNVALNNAGAFGGGVDAEESGDLALLNDTVNGNFAETGGGVNWAGMGVLGVQNTILAANYISSDGTGPDADNPAGTFTDNGGNLIGISGAGSGNTGFTAGTTQTGTVATPLNPLLAPLAYYGGPLVGKPGNTTPLLTEALLLGSTAFGKGVLARAPLTDERGFPSLINNAINVGAVANVPMMLVPGTASVGLNQLVQVLTLNGVPTTVFNVNTTADTFSTTLPTNGFLSLRTAIQLANNTSSAVIINLVVPGTYRITLAGTPGESDNAAGEFAIYQTGATNPTSLTIRNFSGGAITVDGNHLNRVFDINPNNVTTSPKFSVTMSGFSIINGIASPGDAAPGSGGGIRDQNNVSLTLNNMTIANNIATADGGGVSMENAPASTPWTLTVNNSTVTGNHAGDAGGGLETDGSGKVFVNPNSVISNNTSANQGAGIWLDAIGVGSANLTVTGALVSGNAALSAGGFGGGIANAGNGVVAIAQSTIQNNFGGAVGGGFGDQNNLGSLSVITSLFANNVAVGNGGGIQEGGPTTSITASQIQGNATGGVGAGIDIAGNTLTVLNSTFFGNVSASNGGGIELATTGTGANQSTLTNVTIVANLALNNATGFGGGIDAEETGDVALLYDTINGNFASGDGTNSGSGVFWAGNGVFGVQNTIIAANLIGLNAGSTGNSVGPDAFNVTGSFTDNGGNLIGIAGAGSGNTGFTAGTTQTGTVATPLNPLLAPLGFYTAGSPVGWMFSTVRLQTEPLGTGSPGLGRGLPVTPPNTDARGLPRVVNGKTDVGAVESQ